METEAIGTVSIASTGSDGPRRSCIGCRRVAGQSELVRVIRTEDGRLGVGRALPGRGAWLCAGSPACIDLAARKGAFSRAFRGPVTDVAVASLREALRHVGG